MKIEFTPNRLTVHWNDGSQNTFTALWLRDNHAAARTANGQRLHEMATLPSDSVLTQATLNDAGMLTIVWQDGFTTTYDVATLRTMVTPPVPSPITLWNHTLQVTLPEGDYNTVSTSTSALQEWLGLVHRYGFAVLRKAPTTSETVLRVVEWFGYVRETNYGRYFDVRTVANPNNLAYTGLPLSAHTDNPYRDPVPTLQLLHCLTSDVGGGDSIVVDGFALADQLRQHEPDAWELLTTTPVTFRFKDDLTDLQTTTPIIRLNSDGHVSAIRYNNRSLAPFNFPPDLTDAYYAAYLTFARMVDESQNQLCFHMEPGDLFIVDNERVLHGRTGFSGSGTRHLQGCYADRDGLLSRYRVLSK